MSRNKESKSRLKKEEIIARTIDLFNAEPTKVFNYKQVSTAIHAVNTTQKQMVVDTLEDLLSDDFLVLVSPGLYKLNNRSINMEGIFERRSNGKNRVLTEEGYPIFIAERNSLRAMNGDKVRIQLYAKRKNRQPEGEVIEILEKAPQVYVGTLDVQPKFAFLVTDNKILANDIFIPKEKLKGGKDGQKAVVRITGWPERAKNPHGEVIDVLGTAGENNTEIHAILAEFGLPYNYPENVIKAAERIPETIPEEEIKKREDFRAVTTFTIDPKTPRISTMPSPSAP